ncbi:uncharacterized protein EDB93DRAFT_1282152 [Suillus bovinus]|uniref:uncharacterized protein n=1 Tax=Suillus bovinus TaxID=48563 RepID=UPI001B87D80F|nr:uncharacterized protein EDB93DRAFT_1282152 [Suillus bovinus]KAG2147452.1 hypothetical protein EDB93DRAFT_1282152 [Suillus bovinus]
MSDSFADLWSSSVPSNPTSPQVLGAAKQRTAVPQRSQDTFSLLSASQPTSRTHSPQVAGPTTRSRNPVPVGGARNVDAFSSLFSGSLADGRDNNTTNMTMAERAAAAQRAKLQPAQAPPRVTAPLPSAWDGLDSLARQATPSHPSPSRSPQVDLDFSAFASSSTTTVKSPVGYDGWSSHDSTAPQPQTASQKKPAGTLWDLDDFDSSSHSNSPIPPRSRTPGDFDFGDRDDGLLETHSDDSNDDILGDLARPVDAVKPSSRFPCRFCTHHSLIGQNQSTRTTPSPQAPQLQRVSSRPVSPPPHIVGQIVEMGFSPQQARIALAATDTGLDVQAALETLLANGSCNTSTPPLSSHDEVRPPPRRPPNQRINSNRDRDREVLRSVEPETRQSPDLNVQAEKIIAQASEIGISVFNRANAFWKESKEKAQRLYEERANAARAGAGTKRGDGRPRWISDEVPDRAGVEQHDRRVTGGFKDDDQISPPTRQLRQQDGLTTQPPPQPVELPSQSQLKEVDLFSSEAPVYQSPFRRGRPTPQPQPPAAPSRPAPVPSPPKPQRVLVPASSSALSTSASHKATGTSAYKLGQYANAESAYSLAIAALPASHILLVPLHNNRALARLKTGETCGAIEDCASVIEIVGDDRGVIEGVDLGDALVKAWRRRAEAYEGREKWENARKDWELVAGAAWAPSNIRAEGARGAGRCRRMLNSNADENTPVPKPKPKPKATSIKPAPSSSNSGALKALRAATSAAEAEDNQRYELKDSVDTRLAAWKGGKEANLRALIASLDSVLWPELKWQKVGMHELVSNAQVKSRYTRAIARVHPDKLNAQNTTVEQRMIANGVFSALNEAWNAFQQ